MYRTEYYSLEELAHPQIIRTIGEENTWRRLDEDCLRDLDTIRKKWYAIYGTGIYCNRLELGIDSRGLRPPNDPDGSFYSIHKQGMAFDIEPVNGSLYEFYRMVIKLIENKVLIKINTVESLDFTPSWLHIAYMNHAGPNVLIIKP